MSAPSEAVPLSEENTEWLDADLPSFVCEGCGNTGEGHTLLCVEDDVTLWCPFCRTAAWIWK